ncbi:cobalamin biosynthesis protein CobG [Streptomyces roseicoloratus]|uniref:cobalamin biosynthesis protein CobG n=1 Tax=Streptomyces roseicoloratus TaxID=2508722 RepID=UPI001FE45559|nr:cobalamin biosynthesis protein CobG [Streptomyces roseicoloratus]
MPATPHASSRRDEPLIRDRGDACPGALRLHRADDGFLARLRLPGGRLTGRQVELLADAAERLGDGGISITSRGNAELRGLRDGCGGELAALLEEGGLLPSPTHERVRNIVASPAAGLDGLGCADVQLWVRELDALLCGEPWAAGLSGRFLFVLDDGRGDVAGLGGDVTLVAADDPHADDDGRGAGPHALVRLGPQAFRVAAADAPRAALAAAGAFLRAAEEAGNGAWRVRELPGGHIPDLAGALARAGITADPMTEAAAHPVADARTPHRDPRGTRPHGTGPHGTGPHAGPLVPGPLVPGPLGGGAATVADAVSAAGAGTGASSSDSDTGADTGTDSSTTAGTGAVYVLAPLGRLTAVQLRALLPADEVRLTPWRGVVVRTDPARLPELAACGLVTRPDAPGAGVTACTGRPGCAKSLADVRAEAARAPAGRLPVHFSGCERRCGHPHGTWVDVLATGDGDYLVDGAPTPRTSLPEAVATARTTTR